MFNVKRTLVLEIPIHSASKTSPKAAENCYEIRSRMKSSRPRLLAELISGFFASKERNMKYAYDYCCPSSNFRSLMVVKISSFSRAGNFLRRPSIEEAHGMEMNEKAKSLWLAGFERSDKTQRVKRVTRWLPIQVSVVDNSPRRNFHFINGLLQLHISKPPSECRPGRNGELK